MIEPNEKALDSLAREVGYHLPVQVAIGDKEHGSTTILRDAVGVCLADLMGDEETLFDKYMVAAMNGVPGLLAKMKELRSNLDSVLDAHSGARQRAQRAEDKLEQVSAELGDALKVQRQYGQATANMETALCAERRRAEAAEQALREAFATMRGHVPEGKTIVSVPGNAWDVVIQDRDAWKSKAGQSEKELADTKLEAERHRQKWWGYEQEYILPCFKWAQEIGFDLPGAVQGGGANCVELFVQHLRSRLKDAERECDDADLRVATKFTIRMADLLSRTEAAETAIQRYEQIAVARLTKADARTASMRKALEKIGNNGTGVGISSVRMIARAALDADEEAT